MIKCFQKILVVLKRTFKLFTVLVLKRTNWRLDRFSTAAAVWRWLSAEETEAELVAADVLAVRRWCLEERWLVLDCRLVKMAEVCQSFGGSQTEKVLICCVGFLRL